MADGLKRLIELAKRERTPVVDVSAAVLLRLHEDAEEEEAYSPRLFAWLGGAAAAAAAVAVVATMDAWLSWHEPLAELLPEFQAWL